MVSEEPFVQISVQLYSVRESFAADPAATLRRLAELGLRAVEPFGLTEHAETLRPLLAEFGLDAPSSHVSLLDAEDPVRVFAGGAGRGVGTVIQRYWERQAWDGEEAIRAAAERLNALAALASEAGLRVGYHNREFEARPIFDGRCGLEVLVDHLDPRVVLELDTRSEEHTSELQSRGHLVCRLLLEKKKNLANPSSRYMTSRCHVS